VFNNRKEIQLIIRVQTRWSDGNVNKTLTNFVLEPCRLDHFNGVAKNYGLNISQSFYSLGLN
jgi:hypothetical protein